LHESVSKCAAAAAAEIANTADRLHLALLLLLLRQQHWRKMQVPGYTVLLLLLLLLLIHKPEMTFSRSMHKSGCNVCCSIHPTSRGDSCPSGPPLIPSSSSACTESIDASDPKALTRSV
jgi:hypothetical protein